MKLGAQRPSAAQRQQIMTFLNESPRPAPHLPSDPLPDPEPAAPSLPEPDPGVFHHEPQPQPGTPQRKP